VFGTAKLRFFEQKIKKNAIFFRKIWSIQKKAVLLQPLSQKMVEVEVRRVKDFLSQLDETKTPASESRLRK